jgi:hypothetical protein
MNRKKTLAAFAFFFFFWFGLLYLSGSLTSGFHFTDDHQIISFSKTLESAGAIETALDWVERDVRSIGRFLPVYYIHRLLQIKVFGTEFLYWGLYDGLLAWLSSSLLATFMLLAGFSLLEALIFPCLLFLGFQAGIWWRFGTAETIAMVILGAALAASASSARKRSIALDILFIAAGVLLMLTKETFILFIPALLFLKVWLTKKERRLGWPGALKAEALPVAVLLFLSGAAVLYIKLFVGTTGIGYAGYEGISAGPFLSALVNYLFASQSWLVALGFALAVSALPRERRPWGDIAAIFVLLGLSLLPQAALHAKSGVSERYILPGIFGLVFAAVYFLRLTREALSKGTPGLRWRTLAAWAAALAFIVLGSYMMGHRKLTTTFSLESLSLLSGVDHVPFMSFAAAWFHAFTQNAFLWVASLALMLSVAAARSAFFSRFLNQRTFLAFVFLWAAFFNFSICFDRAFLSAFQGRKTNEWLRSIEANTGKDDPILVVADPALNNEWALSIKRYLSIEAGRENLYAYPVLTRPAYTPFEKTLIDSFGSLYPGRDISNAVDPSSFKAVVIFPNAEEAFLAGSTGWFDPSGYAKYVNEYGFTSYYRAR